MVVTADVVIQNLYSGVGSKSNKPYYVFECVVVGCQKLPIIAGCALKKFISEDVYNELGTLTQDRFDCLIGISRAPVSGQECDIGFKLFINGLPKDDEAASSSDSSLDVSDKNMEKGGKK